MKRSYNAFAAFICLILTLTLAGCNANNNTVEEQIPVTTTQTKPPIGYEGYGRYIFDGNSISIENMTEEPAVFDAISAQRIVDAVDCKITSIHIENVSGLEDLSFLGKLNLSKVKECTLLYCDDLKDISIVRKMGALEQLIVIGSPELTDISSISESKKLMLLNVSYTGLQEIPDMRMKSLTSLIVMDNDLHDISNITPDNYPKLKGLSVSGNEITDLSPIIGMNDLETVEAVRTTLDHDVFVEVFTNMPQTIFYVDLESFTEDQNNNIIANYSDSNVIYPTGTPVLLS